MTKKIIKRDERQPNLFGDIDDIINALSMEETEKIKALEKLGDARNKAEKKEADLSERLAALRSALKKTHALGGATKKAKK